MPWIGVKSIVYLTRKYIICQSICNEANKYISVKGMLAGIILTKASVCMSRAEMNLSK